MEDNIIGEENKEVRHPGIVKMVCICTKLPRTEALVLLGRVMIHKESKFSRNEKASPGGQ